MKTLIRVLLIIAVLLAVGLGTWAVQQRYEAYRNDQQAKEIKAKNQAAAAKAEAEDAVEADMHRLRVSYEIVRQECLKGAAAYSSLSTFNQSKLAAPSCGDALKQ
jgi:hypothetical protein